jgi:hypothetical protein
MKPPATAEDTLFLDAEGTPIRVGDIVRAPVTINQRFHGTWADYRIRKAPGGYVMAYLRSEKGPVLPEGYTAGYMTDNIPDSDETDLKTLAFALVPIQVMAWKVQP